MSRPCFQRLLRPTSLFCMAALALSTTGCVDVNITHLDDAIKEIRQLRELVERESIGWKTHLEKMQKTLKTDMEYTVRVFGNTAVTSGMCYTEFLEKKFISYLKVSWFSVNWKTAWAELMS